MQKWQFLTSTATVFGVGVNLQLPLAKAAYSQQRLIVIHRPDVSAVDSNVVLVSACRGKEDSG
jgi:hypothetical protein